MYPILQFNQESSVQCKCNGKDNGTPDMVVLESLP